MMKRFAGIALAVLLGVGCEEEVAKRPFPRVRTHEAHNITKESASFTGEITFAAGEITEHGFAISNTAGGTVDLDNSQVISLGKKAGKGKFESTVTSALEANVTYYVRAYAKSADYLVFGEIQEFVSLGSAAPNILSVAPLTGTWGDTVTISGKNFSTQKIENKIQFANTSGTVIFASNDMLKVIVPSSLRVLDAPLSMSLVGNIATFPQNFNLHKPIISSISAQSAFVGSPLTITGKYFNPQGTKAFIDGIQLEMIAATKTELAVKIPATTPFGEKSIRVVTGEGDMFANKEILVKQPVIHSISPETGTFGDIVTITGEGFASSIVNNQVFFGAASGTIQTANATELTVRVPEAMDVPSSTLRLFVNESSFYSTRPFTLRAPIINNVSHTVVFAGEQITLNGDYFNPDPARNTVTFGTGALEIISASKTQVVAKFPIEVYTHEEPFNLTVAKQTAKSVNVYTPWIRIADFPGGFLGESVSIVYGDDVYVGTGGEWDSPNRQFYRFNTVTNTWTKLKNFPAENRFYAIGFAENGNIYMGGGLSRYDFYRYEIATDTWTQIANLPFGDRGYIGFTFPELKKHYALVYTVYMKAQLWQFDAATETWTAGATVTADVQTNHMMSFVVGNDVYLKSYHGFSSFSGATGIWTNLTDFSPSIPTHGFGFCFGSDCYFSGEYDYYNHPTTRTYRFSLPDKSLNDYHPYMGPPRDACAFFQVGKKGYMVSGEAEYRTGSIFDKRMYEFIPQP